MSRVLVVTVLAVSGVAFAQDDLGAPPPQSSSPNQDQNQGQSQDQGQSQSQGQSQDQDQGQGQTDPTATTATPTPTPTATPTPTPTPTPTSPSEPASASASASAGAVSDPPTEEDEEDEDSWGVFFIEAQAGYSFANLVMFNADNFIPEAEDVSGNGFFGGAALGFRIYFLTLGARATIASYFGFEIGTAGVDIALHLPIPFISPYIRVGLGYAWMGDADWTDPGLSSTDVHGLAADVGLGLNIKLARILSLGVGFDAAFLNLGRQSIRDGGSIAMVNLEESGDAVGLQLRLHAHLTLHI